MHSRGLSTPPVVRGSRRPFLAVICPRAESQDRYRVEHTPAFRRYFVGVHDRLRLSSLLAQSVVAATPPGSAWFGPLKDIRNDYQAKRAGPRMLPTVRNSATPPVKCAGRLGPHASNGCGSDVFQHTAPPADSGRIHDTSESELRHTTNCGYWSHGDTQFKYCVPETRRKRPSRGIKSTPWRDPSDFVCSSWPQDS